MPAAGPAVFAGGVLLALGGLSLLLGIWPDLAPCWWCSSYPPHVPDGEGPSLALPGDWPSRLRGTGARDVNAVLAAIPSA